MDRAGQRYKITKRDGSNMSIEHITKTPGVHRWAPHPRHGHRRPVREARPICRRDCPQYPGITLADVHAALAYFLDHRPEIEAEFRQDEEAVRQLLARRPSKVQAKLHG
jgi:hypothetical protein